MIMIISSYNYNSTALEIEKGVVPWLVTSNCDSGHRMIVIKYSNRHFNDRELLVFKVLS